MPIGPVAVEGRGPMGPAATIGPTAIGRLATPDPFGTIAPDATPVLIAGRARTAQAWVNEPNVRLGTRAPTAPIGPSAGLEPKRSLSNGS